jgi:hypothetical protein
MGYDLHPDPKLGKARSLRDSGANTRIEEIASAWVRQRTSSRIEICFSFRVKACVPERLVSLAPWTTSDRLVPRWANCRFEIETIPPRPNL